MLECIICRGDDTVPFLSGLRKCIKCGHVAADMNINAAELNKIYDKNYFFGDEYVDYIADRRVLQKNFKKRLQVLQRFCERERHKRLFEIGSAYGFFLDVARDQFQTVQGIDVTDDGVRYATEVLQLSVIRDDFLQQDFKDQKFDVVCMWDTIEHLPCPQQFIDKISSHTEQGALLAITTGDIGSLNARVKKGRWRLIHPPTHIHYFSKKTLTTLLDIYGFDTIYSRHCGFSRSMDNAAYNMLVLRNNKQWLYDLLRTSHLTEFDFYLNLYDIMYVIARRR